MENEISLPKDLPVDPAPPVVSPTHNKTLLFIIAGVVFFIIVIATGLFAGFSLISKPVTKKNAPVETPPPPRAIEKPKVPSKFASDSGLLKIREEIGKIQTEIDTTDLYDAQISPPNLNLGIQIQ